MPERSRALLWTAMGATVIFARGDTLFRTDPKGKAETPLAKLPAREQVRALRTDEHGTVLLANVGGKWSWMPLDGKASALTELPCGDGPAQLSADGACVLCRAATVATASTVINLETTKAIVVAIPTVGARLVGAGKDRRIVWADTTAVWAAPPTQPSKKVKVADAPLRGFLPNGAGTRAAGVYLDKVYDSVHTTKPAELLMTFPLDGSGARRKSIKSGIAAEWSHDGEWMLVQDRGSACVVHATGGEYKCWRGYTAASVAPDGRWGLIVGSRERGQTPPPAKKSKKKNKAGKRPPPQVPGEEPSNESENKGEDGEDGADDVEVPPPSGPLALYRANLEGAYTTAPALIVKVIDGAAVWVPGR